MHSNNLVNKNVEETLDSLQGIRKAGPQPFFYTRVHARLNRKKEDAFERISYYITKPSFVTAGIGVIILMNVLAISLQTDTPDTVKDEQERVYSGEEYTLAVNSFYAIETAGE